MHPDDKSKIDRQHRSLGSHRTGPYQARSAIVGTKLGQNEKTEKMERASPVRLQFSAPCRRVVQRESSLDPLMKYLSDLDLFLILICFHFRPPFTTGSTE